MEPTRRRIARPSDDPPGSPACLRLSMLGDPVLYRNSIEGDFL
jgi:hypothetical protein